MQQNYTRIPQSRMVSSTNGPITVNRQTYLPQAPVNLSQRLCVPFNQPHLIHPSPRMSMASSQKYTLPTQADLSEMYMGNSSVMFQSQRRGQYTNESMVCSQTYPLLPHKNMLMMDVSAIVPANLQQNPLCSPIPQIDLCESRMYPNIPNFSSRANHYSIEEHTYTPAQIVTTTQVTQPVTCTTALIPMVPIVPVATQNIVHNTVTTETSSEWATVTKRISEYKIPMTVRANETLIGGVTVYSIPQCPRIRKPTKRINNRLYKSAVEMRNKHASPISYYLDRRPTSLGSSRGRSLKREVYVHKPHRVVATKMIPTIGSYIGNDKSSGYILREHSTCNLPKTNISRVVEVRQEEAIPTEIIRVHIGKVEQIEPCLLESVDLLDKDIVYTLPMTQPARSPSITGNRINKSLSTSRLSDNLRISVFKSPDVVVTQPQLIVSGPKLSKQHVLRVAGEGKTVHEMRAGIMGRTSVDSRAHSLSPVARYMIPSVTMHPQESKSSPFSRECQHISFRVSAADSVSTPMEMSNIKCNSAMGKTQASSSSCEQRLAEVSNFQPFQMTESHVSSYGKSFEACTSSYRMESIEQIIEAETISY